MYNKSREAKICHQFVFFDCRTKPKCKCNGDMWVSCLQAALHNWSSSIARSFICGGSRRARQRRLRYCARHTCSDEPPHRPSETRRSTVVDAALFGIYLLVQFPASNNTKQNAEVKLTVFLQFDAS